MSTESFSPKKKWENLFPAVTHKGTALTGMIRPLKAVLYFALNTGQFSTVKTESSLPNLHNSNN